MTHFHGVHFYESSDSICGIVAAFLGTGFITSEPAIVIATPEHQDGVGRALAVAGFSVDALQRAGMLLMRDARAMLSQLQVADVPDPVRFESVVGREIEHLSATRQAGVRVYDEMVDLLWKTRQPAGAIRLETLWDRLTFSRRCSLLCGHAVGNYRRHAGAQSLCALHSHVVADNGLPHPLSH